MLVGGASAVEPGECLKVDVEGTQCDGHSNRHYPVAKIDTEKMSVDRINLCAARDSTIEFRVGPPGKNDVGSVAIKAKHDGNLWLLGNNSPDKKVIRILIPAWVDDNTDHDYTIYLSDGACIDPRVHVED
jgi:hypothetical protein